ncbi:MAG: type II toxin-antitoxin system VapC family toxin [Pseudolabrys sp.]|nr:type II toxin-antitoxin system VapC family toxin [Pseudolabrys sp.]
MTVVIDASVAVLWTLQQTGSDRAAALSSETGLIAPSIILAEVGNAIWKAVRRGDLPRAESAMAIDLALSPFEQLTSVEELRVRALEIALELDHPIYDCFYLALAERERCPMVTADKRLLTAAKKFKSVEVRAL